jgi:hypothetical protein
MKIQNSACFHVIVYAVFPESKLFFCDGAHKKKGMPLAGIPFSVVSG